MLKKEVAAETQQNDTRTLRVICLIAEYLMTEFKIPEDYIDGFVVYASENEKVAKAVKDKNKTLTAFLLGGLADEFNKMLADGK